MKTRKFEIELTEDQQDELNRISTQLGIPLQEVLKQSLVIPRDAVGWYPKFVPDQQGGHIRFNGNIWRPAY